MIPKLHKIKINCNMFSGICQMESNFEFPFFMMQISKYMYWPEKIPLHSPGDSHNALLPKGCFVQVVM